MSISPRHVRSGRVPDGYVEVDFEHGRALASPESAAWVGEVVAGGGTLHGWAGAIPQRSTFPGRGQVFAVPAPVGPGSGADIAVRWAVRHYIRGGAVAMHLGDRHLRTGRPRPFREVAASSWARSRGIRSPRVIAAAMYTDGPFYRADIVTEVVEGAVTLADRLHETDGERGWLVAMAAAGDLARSLAETGLYHVDLNARNVLVDAEPEELPWIIDLDRARILGRPSPQAADRMLARLTRSIVKIGTPTGEPLGTGEVLAALETRGDSL